LDRVGLATVLLRNGSNFAATSIGPAARLQASILAFFTHPVSVGSVRPNLGGGRHDCCPPRGMLTLVIQGRRHTAPGQFWAGLAGDGSTFSGVGLGERGAVRRAFRYELRLLIKAF
jgi:hypothetical protein